MHYTIVCLLGYRGNDIRVEVMRVRDSTRRCNSMQLKQELRDFKCITITKQAMVPFDKM